MDLMDALASNRNGRSVVELSLNRAFRQGYRSVYAAIDALTPRVKPVLEEVERIRQEERLQAVVGSVLPEPTAHWVFAVDGLSLSRPHAATLHDRGYVHWTEGQSGGPPVTVGHGYSLVAALPAKVGAGDPPWAVPVSTRRVGTHTDALTVACEQMETLLGNEAAAWQDQLAVLVADSGYGVAPFLGRLAEEAKLVTVTRLRANRTLYRLPAERDPQAPGRPLWYGDRFKLDDDRTQGEPDAVITFEETTRRGRQHTVSLEVWENLVMRGKRDLPMHRHPFTLIRVTCRDAAGKLLFRRPMWLAISGARRSEITARQAYAIYRQRFDQEHMHRFARQRLLLDAFQTPETEREENWMCLVGLTYAHLFAARHLARHLPRPWERAKPLDPTAAAGPTMVQRDMDRILACVGTPASAPKRRGKSPGRAKGISPPSRWRYPPTKKPKKPKKSG